MRRLLSILAIFVFVSCAVTPPPMTDLERSQMATVEYVGDVDETLDTLTRFLMSFGFSIDRYDENTRILTTQWRSRGMGAQMLIGKAEMKIHAMIIPQDTNLTKIEFWIYDKFEDIGRENLNLYATRYEDLLKEFNSFIGEGVHEGKQREN